ncbi:MAG TPA: NAD(P)-dependent alcohol dehydrogenase [Gemmatimonadaceae bacterium]|nr:NAD(P)-dependent alcohol dehydrogenase [Gemmatimonadaceae bacterium]
MKAIVQTAYGSPDRLELRDIDIPGIEDNGVLVEVHAAAVNALDWHATRGMPYLIRMGTGLKKPKPTVLGVDLAGRVRAVGSKVTRLKPGDEVFGGTNGSFAEYTATVEDRLALKRAGFTYEQEATLHVAAMTALQGLCDKAQLRPGQSVLINGRL